MAQQAVVVRPPSVQGAISNVVALLREPVLSRANFPTEAQYIVSALKAVTKKDLATLLQGLKDGGVETEFFQTAHPRWGPYVRDWLASMDVSWETIHNFYVYDLGDSAEFYAGFLAGMGFSLAELPMMVVKLGRSIVDGELVADSKKFFSSVYEVWNKGLMSSMGVAASQWKDDFEKLIYELRWFEAGAKLGNALANIAMFGEGAAKVAAALPRFVKMLPALEQVGLVLKGAAGITVRTAEQAAVLLKAVWGVLFVVPDFRFSRLLPALMTPGDLRALLKGAVSVVSKSGFEFIYVESTKNVVGIVRSGVLPSDFVPASVVIVRRGGKVVGRIFDPRSLAALWRDVPDGDFEGALDALLKDAGAPAMPKDAKAIAAMHDLVVKAQKSADFAEKVATLNLRYLATELAQVASKRAKDVAGKLKASASYKPNAATFGTLVESDMKPIVDKWMAQYPHLIPHRGQSLTTVLGEFVSSDSKLLKMTVAEFVTSRPDVARMLGFDGKNLSKVLSANAKTLIGDLKVDLFVRDPFGHQGVLLDFTSFLDAAHFNKTLLYHSVIATVFPNMRLPFGEMFHCGFTQ